MKTCVFGIDWQNSFIEIISAHEQQQLHTGELCVAGAVEDSNRLTAMIDRIGGKIHEMVFTLDSHLEFHIAHARWYVSNGKHPNPSFVGLSQLKSMLLQKLRKYQINYVLKKDVSQLLLKSVGLKILLPLYFMTVAFP